MLTLRPALCDAIMRVIICSAASVSPLRPISRLRSLPVMFRMIGGSALSSSSSAESVPLPTSIVARRPSPFNRCPSTSLAIGDGAARGLGRERRQPHARFAGALRQHFDDHIVAFEAQLGQSFGDGVLRRFAGYL